MHKYHEMMRVLQKMSNRIVDLEKERDIQKINKPHYRKKEDNNQWQVPPPNVASINMTEIGRDNFCTFHQQPHSEKKCPQWIHSMTLVMNKLLNPELTRDNGEEEKEKQTIVKPNDDNMFSWNGVSLFNVEEDILESQYTPTTTKYESLAIKDNAIISKVPDLQKEVKGQADVKAKDDIPKDIHGK